MPRKIIGFVLLGVAAVGGIAGIAVNNMAESIPPAALLCIVGLILILKKGKTTEQKEQKKTSRELEERVLSGQHMAGLPLAEGAPCTVFFEGEKVSISGGGNAFDLAISKISDISIKTDVEIQKRYVSSVGGAVGGAVLFGPLGAIVGGRSKKKETKTIEYYLIITYDKDGNIAYLSFQIFDVLKANKLIKEYKELLPRDPRKKIEL